MSGYIEIKGNEKEIQNHLFKLGWDWNRAWNDAKKFAHKENKYNHKFIYFWEDKTMHWSNKKHPKPYIKEVQIETWR
jgi:hypothetical protein